MVNIQSEDELREYLKNNLFPMEEAKLITEQSTSSFLQSVAAGKLVPFYQTTSPKGRSQNKLFIKSELEEYRDNKRPVR